MNKKFILRAYGLIFVTVVTLQMLSAPVLAWKPPQHVGMGHIVLEDLMPDGKINIRGSEYLVNSLIANAISAYPQYYLMGTIGPDAYPDMYFGQSFIHPDTVSAGGARPSYSYQWLDHLLNCAADNYPSDNGKALAFTYGFMTHAAGDMWCHTFVNRYAGGVWPPIGPDMRIAARHIVVESYVDKKKTQWSNINPFKDNSEYQQFLNDDDFHEDFIYPTFIDNTWARDHSESMLFDLFFGLKDQLEEWLKEWEKDWWDLDRAWWSKLDIPGLPGVKTYLENWKEDIIIGLKAWPRVSSEVAYNLFILDNVDQAKAVLDDWVDSHFLKMIGFPDWVADIIAVIGDIVEWVTGLLEEAPVLKELFEFFADLKKDVVDWIFKQVFGVSLTDLKSMFNEPEKWLDGEILFQGEHLFEAAPYGIQTREKIDEEFAASLAGGTFNPYAFDATYNTIMMSKLLLLDGAALNELLADYGVDPLYASVEAVQPSDLTQEGMCAMRGFIKSLDAHYQWMITAPDGHSYGAGMPLWENVEARERVFKKIFHLGLDMNMTPILDIVPGDRGTYDIEVINTGNVPDTFVLSVDGLPGTWWYELSATEVSLDSGVSTHVSLYIEPYRHWSTAPGDYSFTVTGTSQKPILLGYDLVATKIETAIVHVLPFHEVSVSVTPETSITKPGETSVYSIEVRNRGNVPDSFDVSFMHPQRTSVPPEWIVIDKTFMTLDPCDSDIATLSITVPNNWAGMEDATYGLTITATSQADPTATADASATLTVEATKRSKAEYVKLEIMWLMENVANSQIDECTKKGLLLMLEQALIDQNKAIEYIIFGYEMRANMELDKVKSTIYWFRIKVGMYMYVWQKIPPYIAERWMSQAWQIRRDLTTTIQTSLYSSNPTTTIQTRL